MSVPRPTRVRALVLALAFAASLGIAACGGDDDETTATVTDPAATTVTGADTTSDTGAVSSEIREQFDEVVRQSLESAAAAGAPIDVECVIDRLQTVLSDEDVQALIEASQNGEQPPSSIQEELANAGAECVSQ